MNRTRRMFHAWVGGGVCLLFPVVSAVFMVPHPGFAATSALADVVVGGVEDVNVSPTPPVSAEVIGTPGNLGRAKVGLSLSTFATVGVETRTRGNSSDARSATAIFTDFWTCQGLCFVPPQGLPVLTRFRVHGVIDDLLGNPALPIDPSFLDLFITYTAFSATGIHEQFRLELCYDGGPCNFSASLNGTDITNLIQIGTNALGQTTLTLEVTNVSFRDPSWSDAFVAKAQIQPFGDGSTADHVLDFLSTFGVEITSLDPNVVWESQGGRVSAQSGLPLTALSPATVWVGLKNSDDVGTNFDLKAEVYEDGTLVGSGQLNGAPGGSSGFNNARLDSIPLTLPEPVNTTPGSTLSIKLSGRIACSVRSHRSGTARLWFNDAQANSRFGATVGGVENSYFLLDGFHLGTAPGPGPKKTMDVFLDSKSACPDRPFTSFGTWSITLP